MTKNNACQIKYTGGVKVHFELNQLYYAKSFLVLNKNIGYVSIFSLLCS